MYSKIYFFTVAFILIFVGILGFANLIGPDPLHSPWGSAWYFDTGENIGHTIVGLFLLYAAFKFPKGYRKIICLLSALAGTFAGLYSLIISTHLLEANF